ncbi:uncharacterized protein LOC106770273 [Vigna radiata var. radiata]|uniref:Uncharacterized protein LOC106770273 n=1 Tax=Vigna radiata var. radiata TaxID=3916 RepID=A0A3Q0FAP3_VIGRR|nr:uncharacterized protein LOC106770273 [Vigna radiata var. radiata]
MWHLLLVVAVAGSTGFVTKRFLNNHRNAGEVENANIHDPSAFTFSSSESASQRDGIFTFSSSKSLTQQDGPKSRRSRASKNGVRAPKVEVRPEQRNGGRRLRFLLKKREIAKSVAAKSPFHCFKDNSLFSWGICFGIMHMMSAGKAEINKLNETMNETAKLVQELKSEVNKRKSSCDLQNLDSVGYGVRNSSKIRGRNVAMHNNTNNEPEDTDLKIWSPVVNDSGECGSSALTEEPEPQVLEMDQLEAELEFELQKISGCTTGAPWYEETEPNLNEFEAPDDGYHGKDDWNFNYSESHGVSASELHQKLSHLLIKQQENQIVELESELHQAQSNLREKEAELHALKNCVKHFTELSLSTVSDDETQALTDSKGTSYCGNNNIMDFESKPSIVGTKRPLDSESCS